ncbi:arginine--tRNA ligase, partial [bacterium]|nr:arginine--tRNA ligase [bacterium]
GAVWFKSSAYFDDKDRVIIRSNGQLTYLAADIAYHEDKIKRGYDKLVNIWGADHHGYVARVKSAIKAFDFDPDQLSVILCQLVRLMRNGVPVQMSTRSGEFIDLTEVIDEVGKDAARFFFLMRKADAQLDFDLEIAKKHSLDNPVYYIHYAYARICSIFKHLNETTDIKYSPKNVDYSALKEKEELDIIKIMVSFEDVVCGCVEFNEPHRLTTYLQELAGSFHTFYNKHRVVTEDKKLTLARLVMIDALRIVIKDGLGILGITALEEM